MAVPVAIIDASMQTRSPRLCDREVSATHEGMVDVFMPFPTPVTSVRPRRQLLRQFSLRSRRLTNSADTELNASRVALERGDLNDDSEDHDNRSSLNHLPASEAVSRGHQRISSVLR